MRIPTRDNECPQRADALEARRELDRRSFILGMITAFCECVAGGCK